MYCPPNRLLAQLLSTGFAFLMLAGCGSQSPSLEATEGKIDVVTAFYPLEFVVNEVGGNLVTTATITKPGAEPHEVELAPQDIAMVANTDLTVYLSSFQPAVDQAVATQSGPDVLDVADAARLQPIDDSLLDEAIPSDDAALDPHFWLDPDRLADVADAVAASLAEVSPQNESVFRTNAVRLRAELARLDGAFRKSLANCETHILVTNHAAFAYLADAYDLQQVAIVGLSPDAEPNPTDLATVTTFVRDRGIGTIYYETLVSPDTAQVIAAETGADTDVLDPIEGLTEQSRGDDYLEIMRANLSSLTEGLSCH